MNQPLVGSTTETTLIINKVETGTNTPLAEMVEKGDVKNIWGSPPDAAYLHPRPFVANTAKEIADGNSAVHGEIVTAIKEQFPDN